MEELDYKTKEFCELFAGGPKGFIGDSFECCKHVFGDEAGATDFQIKKFARGILAREDVKEYLNELDKTVNEEQRFMKGFLTENLKSIVKEMSTTCYNDRKGKPVCPSMMRAVAVNAAKSLMEMYPVKDSRTDEIPINGGSVTFNVIVPQKKKETEETE